MATTLFEATAARFEQTLAATAAFLEKGRAHCEEQGLELAEVVETRLHPDMLPLRFQIVATAHHAAGALASAQSGEFTPASVRRHGLRRFAAICCGRAVAGPGCGCSIAERA